MPATYENIATATGTGSSNTISFTSISSAYTDLVLVANVFTDINANQIIRVNNDSGSNYSATYLMGNGSAASSGRYSNGTWLYVQQDTFATSTVPALMNLHFQNYSNTTTNKTVLVRTNQANRSAEAWVNLWRSTSAINRIDIICSTPSSVFTTNTVVTLYGIKAA